jgi:hypothetical protein
VVGYKALYFIQGKQYNDQQILETCKLQNCLFIVSVPFVPGAHLEFVNRSVTYIFEVTLCYCCDIPDEAMDSTLK